MTIKAIETSYKGYRFRSRLEARWAVFFDKMGWGWKYEYEGYEIGPGEVGSSIGWLPDFEITVPSNYGWREFYVEVKGDPNFFSSRWLGYLDFGGGPPGFADSDDGFRGTGGSKPLVLLGNIPPESKGIVFVPVVSHRKGVIITWAEVTDSIGFQVGPFSRCFWEQWEGDREWRKQFAGGPKIDNFQPRILPMGFDVPKVTRALSAARSARFEHGARG